MVSFNYSSSRKKPEGGCNEGSQLHHRDGDLVVLGGMLSPGNGTVADANTWPGDASCYYGGSKDGAGASNCPARRRRGPDRN